MERERERERERKKGRKRWERRERNKLFILLDVVVYIVLMSFI